MTDPEAASTAEATAVTTKEISTPDVDVMSFARKIELQEQQIILQEQRIKNMNKKINKSLEKAAVHEERSPPPSLQSCDADGSDGVETSNNGSHTDNKKKTNKPQQKDPIQKEPSPKSCNANACDDVQTCNTDANMDKEDAKRSEAGGSPNIGVVSKEKPKQSGDDEKSCKTDGVIDKQEAKRSKAGGSETNASNEKRKQSPKKKKQSPKKKKEKKRKSDNSIANKQLSTLPPPLVQAYKDYNIGDEESTSEETIDTFPDLPVRFKSSRELEIENLDVLDRSSHHNTPEHTKKIIAFDSAGATSTTIFSQERIMIRALERQHALELKIHTKELQGLYNRFDSEMKGIKRQFRQEQQQRENLLEQALTYAEHLEASSSCSSKAALDTCLDSSLSSDIHTKRTMTTEVTTMSEDNIHTTYNKNRITIKRRLAAIVSLIVGALIIFVIVILLVELRERDAIIKNLEEENNHLKLSIIDAEQDRQPPDLRKPW